MMASHLFHFIDQLTLVFILTMALPLKLRIDISIKAVFFQVTYRICIIDRFILVQPGMIFHFCHMIEFSMDADNIQNNFFYVFAFW